MFCVQSQHKQDMYILQAYRNNKYFIGIFYRRLSGSEPLETSVHTADILGLGIHLPKWLEEHRKKTFVEWCPEK